VIPAALLGSQAVELARLTVGRLPAGERLEAIRDRRVRALVRFAHRRVPYYRALLDEAGIRPEDVRTARDLRHVPVSTRSELRAAGEAVLARGIEPEDGLVAHTSGSTGSPWGIFRTQGEEMLRRALELRSMRRAGMRPGDRIVTVGAQRQVRRGPVERLGLFRSIQVSPLLPIEDQVERLREIRASVLWIYPTALRSLLSVASPLAAIYRPRMVVTSAEPLDPLLRDRALDGEPIETRNFYGSVETGRIAWECAAHDGLHVNADCIVLDLVEDDEVPGAGRSVVVTNLLSRAMPVLRYRLGDRCAELDGPCACGAPLPRIAPPVGREWDAIRLPSGRLLSPWGFNVHLRSLDGLLQFRVIQRTLDRLVVQLLFAAPPPAERLAALRARIAEHVAEPMRVDVELVNAFARGPAKFRIFVSEI